MERIARDGTVLTDELLDEMAKEYEAGTWEGPLGEVVMGRPRLFDEELETVSFRLPKSRVDALEAAAKRRGETKSDLFREAVDRFLEEA